MYNFLHSPPNSGVITNIYFIIHTMPSAAPMHLKNMKLVILFNLSLEPCNIWLVKYIGGEGVPQFHCRGEKCSHVMVGVASNWPEFLVVVVPSVLQYHGGEIFR